MNISNIKSVLYLMGMALLSQSAFAVDTKNVDLAAKQIQVFLVKMDQGKYEGAKEHMMAAQGHLEVASREATETAVYGQTQMELTEVLNLMKTNKFKQASATAQKALNRIKAIR
jgi:hypothetical protein